MFASYACLVIDVMQVSILKKNLNISLMLFKVRGEIQPRDNYVFVYLSL